MILKRLEELEGNEILARNIMTLDYKVILPMGVTVRKEYIEKLRELGIEEVYIRDKEASAHEIVILRTELDESVKKTVRDILERHTYRNNQELVELSEAADNIISNIMAEDKVMEKVFDIKERIADVYEHSISVCSLSILTALKLGMKINKIHDIGLGCLLHDIGLRYMTVDYYNQDTETMKRRDVMEYIKHPVYGFSSLKDEKWMSEVSKNVILYHHERMNASGFPLRTGDIPFECRIVNVCDAFDEMICGIGCKRVKVYEAVEYLKNYKKIYFDSKIVDVFLSLLAVYPVGSHVLTNEGEFAVVLSQNKGFQDRPVIQILKDKNGKDIQGEVVKDLVKIHNIFIYKVID